jgi:hypothetical protein
MSDEELKTQEELLSVIESLVKSHRKFFGLDGAFDAELLKAESVLKKYPKHQTKTLSCWENQQ